MSDDTESTLTTPAGEASEPAATTEAGDDRPLLFVSHKHIDRELASVVKNWIEQRTAGGVRVYLSSDATSEGPGIGMNLDDELQSALWDAGVVLLLYTRGDHDWSYCMYECGVATDPHSPDTRVMVLQCGDDVPSPFADRVRIGTNPEEIHKFTVSILTDDGFFPGHRALTGFGAESQSVTDAANDLYDQLVEHLPDSKSGSERWSTWPNLYLELGKEVVAAIREAPNDERRAFAIEQVKAHGRIVDATPGAAMIFGRNEIVDGMAVSELVDEWESDHQNLAAAWFDCLCAQLVVAADRKKAPPISWDTISEIGDDGRHVIGAGGVEARPGDGTIRFHFHFFEQSSSGKVKSEMTKVARIRKIDLDKKPPEAWSLSEVLVSIESDSFTRIPIVSDGGKLRYIVHVSMVDKFIARRALAGEEVSMLTLSDLLADDDMKEIFASTFVVVSERATVADADAAMKAVENCEDVFVTASGSPDEPVNGWLTNKEIAQALGG